jgi:hypothetical protein
MSIRQLRRSREFVPEADNVYNYCLSFASRYAHRSSFRSSGRWKATKEPQVTLLYLSAVQSLSALSFELHLLFALCLDLRITP